ncbi:MAG: succinate dehydrogenase cytochrome b subunit [Elusimicrobia bacterium]|nr:succinate dehydrogenase cytochrome b subunit [Elusimicrobiota bacterium]
MGVLSSLLTSSIGRKILVALAGLLLCGFLIAHLGGNLLLIYGEGPFNRYAQGLEKNPLLPLAEVGLAGLFLAHIAVSLKLRHENRQARPASYAMQRSKGGRSWGSRTMLLSGLLLLSFLVVHVWHFRVQEHADGLYRAVMNAFQSKYYVLFYVAAMAALGLHLSHGFQSAFRTFGLSHPRLLPMIRKTGFAFSAAITVGFALLPLWACFWAKGPR